MIRLTMPIPPPASACFRNQARHGRVRTMRYKTWARAAGNEILAQQPGHIGGTVMVDITCQRKRKSSDIDNRIKACLDLLVTMAVIDDDKNVQEVRCRWGDVEGAIVEVTPA